MKMCVSNLCTGCFNGVGAIDDFRCIDGLFIMVSVRERGDYTLLSNFWEMKMIKFKGNSNSSLVMFCDLR